MRTVLAAALGTLLVVSLFRVQGMAESEETPVQVEAVAPSSPEAWNVWGSALVDELEVSLQPVACAEGTEGLCVEVKAHNPTAELKHVQTQVNLMANNNSPMARVAMPPNLSQSRSLVLQVAAGGDSTQVMSFDLPETVGMGGLSLAIGAPDDYAGGQALASFSTLGLEWELGRLDIDEQAAITF